jgi:hypothetical protein
MKTKWLGFLVFVGWGDSIIIIIVGLEEEVGGLRRTVSE